MTIVTIAHKHGHGTHGKEGTQRTMTKDMGKPTLDKDWPINEVDCSQMNSSCWKSTHTRAQWQLVAHLQISMRHTTTMSDSWHLACFRLD